LSKTKPKKGQLGDGSGFLVFGMIFFRSRLLATEENVIIFCSCTLGALGGANLVVSQIWSVYGQFLQYL
jgi:hypothetical protein